MLDSGITADCSSGSETSTFAIPITLNADQTFEVNGGTLDISAIIGGSAGITKTGAGTLELDGDNTYTGNTTINAGILDITSSTALGASGGSHMTVMSGAELDLGSSMVVDPSSLTIGGTGVDDAGAIVAAGGEDIFESPIMLSADTTIAATGGLLYFYAPISDCGHGYGVTLVGGGTVGYSAQNTYTGLTDVTGGDLNLGNGSGVSLAGPLTIDASSSGSATVAEYADNQFTTGTANVTLIGSGATFDLNGYSDTALSLTFTGGSVTMGGGTLTLGAGGVTTNAASTTATIEGSLSLTASEVFSVAQGGDLSVSASISGAYGLTKTGSGTMTMSDASTYSGGTMISAGVLTITNESALGSGPIFDDAELDLDGNSMTVTNDLTIDSSGTAIDNLSGTYVLSGAITLAGNTTIDAASGTNLYMTGDISESSASQLTVNGGTILLGGTNTYSAGTTVQTGTLDVTSQQATGTMGMVVVDTGAGIEDATTTYTLPSGGLQLNGGQALYTVGGLSYTINGNIALAAGSEIDAYGTSSLEINGVISGSQGLTAGGTSTLILQGTNTYTGTTTVSGGRLQVNGSIPSSGTVDVDSGAILGGSGSVGSVDVTGGTVAPADGPTTLTTSSLSLDGDSTFAVLLDGATAGTYDQVVVASGGSVSLGGATLTTTLGGGYTPAYGDQLTIIQNNTGSAVTGTFSGLAEGASIVLNNYLFRITYQGGINQQDVVLTSFGPVSTWTGGGGLGDENWSYGANWQSGSAPSAGDYLIFPLTASQTSSNNDLPGLDFTGVEIDAAGFDIHGSAILLDDGITATYLSGTSTFGIDTQLTADQTIEVDGGGTLDITSIISGARR